MEHLKNKQIPDPIPVFIQELTAIVEGKKSHLNLKKEVARLGLCIIGEPPAQHYYYQESFQAGTQKFNEASELVIENVWNNKDYYQLLTYLLGEENAVYAKYVWEQMPSQMYQTGYTRRSFRAPHNQNMVLQNQLNFLSEVIRPHSSYDYSKNTNTCYNLSVPEQIRLDTQVPCTYSKARIWAAMIDMGNHEIYQLMEDIIFNKDATGKVSRNIIKVLLNSNKPEAWDLVEKLLLAAQRQEGLRQTVLEALDETSIGALKHMMRVILEHKLTRFSSVVRAIDTWAGLGWNAEKEAVIKNVFELGLQYLNHPETIAKAVKNSNNLEVYMALWAQAVYDVEKTTPYLQELLANGNTEKKSLALKFAMEINIPGIQMPLYYRALADDNLQVLTFCLAGMVPLLQANVKSKYYIDNADFPDFFEKLYTLAQKTSEKEKNFEGKVFSWLNIKFDKNNLYFALISLMGESHEKLERLLKDYDNLGLPVREALTREVLQDYYGYYYQQKKDEDTPKAVSSFQKDFALKVIRDRGESISGAAFKALMDVQLTVAEILSLEDILKRKNAGLRKKTIELILKQTDTVVAPVVEALMQTSNTEQQLIVLDLMIQLQAAKRLQEQINIWAASYKNKEKLSEKETTLLQQLNPLSETTQVSAETGYGLYNPANVSPTPPLPLDSTNLYKQLTSKQAHGFSVPFATIKTEIEKLKALVVANHNHEYKVFNYDGSAEKVLLANTFRSNTYNVYNFTGRQLLESLPLWELWQKWYEESGLTPLDLFVLTLTRTCQNEDWKSIVEPYIFFGETLLENASRGYWNDPVPTILRALKEAYTYNDLNEFLIGAATNLFSILPKSVIEYKKKENGYYYSTYNAGDGWQAEQALNDFLYSIHLPLLNKLQTGHVWQLYKWRQANGRPENITTTISPLHLYCKAFSFGLISEDELYHGIISDPGRISELTQEKNHRGTDYSEFTFLVPIVDRIREHCLDIEMNRGDSSTPTSHLCQQLQKIYGSKRFVQILKGLGKTNLYKGYIYSWNGSAYNAQQMFSTLLKKCLPEDTDTQEVFNQLVDAAKLTEKKLIEAAVYAPQWQKLVSKYLSWKGLDAAVWWMHAHTKTSDYQDKNAEAESEIAKYSSVDLQDFKDGAVDKDWFESAYKELGKSRWEMLYDAAKYISDGNGHRRARLYADVMTGDLKIREVTAKVKDKRDQDYLRVYGLIPLSKTNAEKDILSRYEYLQQFKKESREFGSMKQSSEALAIRVALENLARNAGYPDPIRLTWAMETKQVQSILSKETQIQFGDVVIALVIDESGTADVVARKAGKELKSIPSQYKKEKAVTELSGYKKTLKEQYSRSRKALEEAMIRGDEFSYQEIQNLLEHPVIKYHVKSLIFISQQSKTGFISGANLLSANGTSVNINNNDTLRIAHCVDLHQTGEWSGYQKYCFDHELKQPFKQIFRELYVPTADELQEKSISRRYAGHQVQPKQTVALLKSRGWKIDYETGLQKVFHKDGFAAKMFAMADWYSPADIENPTLETISFSSLKDYKNVAFEEIQPRIFSEVMRDIDLVVSVAHAGAVDPEASHSSIEMRAVLLRESCRLFKLNNVAIAGSHATITGTLGTYSVHLGSAVVHQLPGKYLSILPVHSQQRGRLFLPFADDDPKSAELISKVILLAQDEKIQDPTILTQIEIVK